MSDLQRCLVHLAGCTAREDREQRQAGGGHGRRVSTPAPPGLLCFGACGVSSHGSHLLPVPFRGVMISEESEPRHRTSLPTRAQLGEQRQSLGRAIAAQRRNLLYLMPSGEGKRRAWVVGAENCATWADALRDAVASVARTVPGGQVWFGVACDALRLVGLALIFLIATRAVSLLGLSRREAWRKDAEILMPRHQLAVALRNRPRVHSPLTWPGRAWLALLAGTLPVERLAELRLIVTPATILRWHRDIVRRRWARLSSRGRSGRPPVRCTVRSVVIRLARENESWVRRMHAELAALGVTWLHRRCGRSSRAPASIQPPPGWPGLGGVPAVPGPGDPGGGLLPGSTDP
jgi:hypothetical protein